MKRNWIAAALAALLLLALAACGDDEEAPAAPEEAVPPPEPFSYAVEGLKVDAMPVEDTEEMTERHPSIYTYPALDDPAAAAKAYTESLTAAGYSVVDEALVRTDAPDFSLPEGQLRLAKRAVFPAPEPEEGEDAEDEAKDEEDDEAKDEAETPEEDAAPEAPPPDQVVLLQLDWYEQTCVVTLEVAEGTVTDPPPTEQELEAQRGGMTPDELEDTINAMSPAVFGLEGTSMAEYHVYVGSATVLVDSLQCVRVDVYAYDVPGSTNSIAGTYFMTPSGSHLYQWDQENDSITELTLPESE